jgi:DNA-binding MarR family transcriptional regulator
MERHAIPPAPDRRPSALAGPADEAGFRALGPTTSALIGLGGDLARLLDHLTRRRGSVTFSQYQLLGLLRTTHPEPREPWELGRGLGSGSAQVTALLDGLERAGLLERRTHGRDRRRRWVHLTDAGVECVETVSAQVRALEAHLMGRIGTRDQVAALGRTAENLRAVLGDLTASDLSFMLLADPGRNPEAEEV